MKPTPNFTETKTRRDSQSPRRNAALPLKTDYGYQVGGLDFRGHCHTRSACSFRGISADYFRREARSIFAVEAVAFGVIVLTVAVPVLKAMSGLGQFAQSVGLLW